MILGGVWIETKADLADLILRRQFAATKTVDADLRARPGELIDRVFKLFGIVREFGDLLGGEHVAECRAVRICVSYLRFVGYIDVDFDRIDLKCDFSAI